MAEYTVRHITCYLNVYTFIFFYFRDVNTSNEIPSLELNGTEEF